MENQTENYEMDATGTEFYQRGQRDGMTYAASIRMGYAA
jgi:hypothetical protein